DREPLELVEDRVARRRDPIAPVDAPDRDHVDRRRLLLEDMDLRRARLRAQHVRVVEEERVARRARGVGRQEGELVEVVLDRLDLAVVAHLVAEAEERVLDHAADLRDRVQVADGQLLARERDVDHLLAQPPVELLVAEAVRSGGPVLELGVGTGRIAVPIAQAGVRIVGVDSSEGMLAVAREQAARVGVELDLRFGDLRHPPVAEEFALVVIPFRTLLHMQTDADRRTALAAVHSRLREGGRFVFDVFTPGADDIAETHGRWLEREPGIFERADWDEDARTLTLRVSGDGAEAELSLAWLPVEQWEALLAEAGFVVKGLYGWFDRTPYAGHEDSIWVCRAV